MTREGAVLEAVRCAAGVSLIEYRARCAAVCPLTGDRDHYAVLIALEPKERSIETGSLARYLATFEREEMLAEGIAAGIGEQVLADIHPVSVTVTLDRDEVADGIALRVVWKAE